MPLPTAVVRGVTAPAKPRYRGTSHFYALFVALVAASALVATAPDGLGTVAAAIYATAMVAMFGASALYHRGNWSLGTARRLLQMDHTAIFLMIAGTATPIALLTMDGSARVALLAAFWGIAAAGIVFEWLPISAPRGYVTTVYLSLGSLGLFAFGPIYGATGWLGVALLAVGGLLYAIGAIVHAAHVPDPWPETFGYHEVFHLFVILAVLLQFCAIAFLVLPLG
jgi:hemolysin III